MGAIYHVKSATAGFEGNTAIVNPSDWNSAHAYTLQDAVSIIGTNTAGTLSNISSGTLYLAGANLTLSQNANSVTLSAAGAAGGGTLSVWPDLIGPSMGNSGQYAGYAFPYLGQTSVTQYTFSYYLVPMILPCPLAFSA